MLSVSAAPLSRLSPPARQWTMTAGPADTEARKVVTVLFSDIQGSTRLGEMLDPESMRD